MPEYVYALHDFSPEHEDEIPFKAGDRIEVIEKDDLYGDGWWQGRNLAAKVGLFPQGYTSASMPPPETRTPTVSTPLHSLEEEPPEDVAPPANETTVMAATLTDVQEAIEQLGVHGDQDAARSFSFTSTRDGETDKEADTEDEAGDADVPSPGGDGEDWHRDARKALAERAKKENAKKEDEEANNYPSSRRKSQAPPITVELSDESDAEEEDDAIRNRQHDIHPHHHKFSASVGTPRSPDVSFNDSTTSEATLEPLQLPISLNSNINNRSSQVAPLTPTSLSRPTSPPQEVTVVDTPFVAQPMPQTPGSATTTRFQQSVLLPSHLAEVSTALPSPAISSTGGAALAANIPLPNSPSLMNGIVMSQIPPSFAPSPQRQPQLSKTQDPVTPPQAMKPPEPDAADSLKQTHPSEWSIEQVVEWLKSKNVDEATCAKFIEHEITGDVLLELDVNLLKELHIPAFGKRMRISNAILELRRPASFSAEQHAAALNGFASPASFPGAMNVESSHRPGDIPGRPYGHRHDSSSLTSGDEGTARSLVGLGLAVPTHGAQKNRPAQLALSSPSEGALHKALDDPEGLVLEEGEAEIADERAVQSETETPPASSQSGAKRRRFLGHSTESGSSRDKDTSSRNSKEVSSPMTSIPDSPSLRVDQPSTEDGAGTGVGKRHAKGKRSFDGSKGSERLSFFGATLGKSRKPPPRYSMNESDTSPTQASAERSSRGISRLYLSHSSKKNVRSATPAKDDKEKDKNVKDSKDTREAREINEKDTKDPALLRKRHISTSGSIAPISGNRLTSTSGPIVPGSIRILQPGAKVTLQPGESVLDQIGRPDHAGWLRKKGVRYNTWKLRYMVLKGPHLYYLRSNSRSETKIKGYIKVQGYKVIADENANPGKYGFRIIHDNEQAHYFSSEEQLVVREWMKALMKATIDRDFSKPVVSSCNIPTIPLTVAQAMNPGPRPPSPTAREATQKALRRDNPNQLSSRDARVLMGLPAPENGVPPTNGDGGRLESFFTFDGVDDKEDGPPLSVPAPPRPSRDMRQPSIKRGGSDRMDSGSESELVNWANSVLPEPYQIHELSTDLRSGLTLFRLAESIRGQPSEPPVPDSAFSGEHNLEGMFKLFDFLLDHDIKLGSVSINDIKQGRPDKTMQLLRALNVWGEKRR